MNKETEISFFGGTYMDKESYYLLIAIVFFGSILVALGCITLCYCLKEKHVNEDAKVYYYKNI